MAAVTRQVERLRARAACLGGASNAPVDDLERAKQRLRLEGEGLQAEMELLSLPLVREAHVHPWRTLAVATAGGAAFGWIDEASDGRLHRLALRAFGPWLRTLTARAGLKGP